MFSVMLAQFEALLPFAKKQNPQVSARGVDWHLDHSLRIIVAICNTLEKSNPKEFKPHFNFGKYIILLTGYIPRGRAKSPKPFNSLEPINQSELPALFAEARQALDKLETLPANSYFTHPMFGQLSKAQAYRFILTHSRHHIKIMREIVGN